MSDEGDKAVVNEGTCKNGEMQIQEEYKEDLAVEPVEQLEGDIPQDGEEDESVTPDIDSVTPAKNALDEDKKTPSSEGKVAKDEDRSKTFTKADKGELTNSGEEFVLVEDADSMERQAPGQEGDEYVEVSDESYPGEEDEHLLEEEAYEEEHEHAEHKGIHDVVNEVLDTKLEGFQVQIQKMFDMMQGGSMGRATNKKFAAAGRSVPKGDGDEEDDEDDADNHPADDVGEHGEDSGNCKQDEKQQQVWKEFLGRVSTSLDVSASGTKSVLDETVGTSQQGVEYLPAEGIVKNSWQKIKGKYINELTRNWNLNTRHGYSWSQEDNELYGTVPFTNPDLISYLNHFSDDKLVFGLSSEVKKHHTALRQMEVLFRYQQRIFSYASYFTAALRKNVPENDYIQEILKNLGQCLIDACDSSVYGCVLTTRSIRRHYTDALDILQNTTDPEYDALNLPLAKDLFPQAQLKKVLRSFGINLENPQMSNKVSAGIRGRGFKRGLTRSLGRGASRGGRGGPSTMRGGYRGTAWSSSSPSTMRGGYRGTAWSSSSSRGEYYRGRGGPSRGRGWQPRSRGGSTRGRGMASSSRNVSPGSRSEPPLGGYGRGLKRSPNDTGAPVPGKHRRMERTETVHGSYHNRFHKDGETSGQPHVYGYPSERSRSSHDTRQKSRSPEGWSDYRDRGTVAYPSVLINRSSYYRSPSPPN